MKTSGSIRSNILKFSNFNLTEKNVSKLVALLGLFSTFLWAHEYSLFWKLTLCYTCWEGKKREKNSSLYSLLMMPLIDCHPTLIQTIPGHYSVLAKIHSAWKSWSINSTSRLKFCQPWSSNALSQSPSKCWLPFLFWMIFCQQSVSLF